MKIVNMLDNRINHPDTFDLQTNLREVIELDEIYAEELVVIMQAFIQKDPDIMLLAEYELLESNDTQLSINDCILGAMEAKGYVELEYDHVVIPSHFKYLLEQFASEIESGDKEYEQYTNEDLQTLQNRLNNLKNKY